MPVERADLALLPLVQRAAAHAEQRHLFGGLELPGLGQAPEGAQRRAGAGGTVQVDGRRRSPDDRGHALQHSPPGNSMQRFIRIRNGRRRVDRPCAAWSLMSACVARAQPPTGDWRSRSNRSRTWRGARPPVRRPPCGREEALDRLGSIRTVAWRGGGHGWDARPGGSAAPPWLTCMALVLAVGGGGQARAQEVTTPSATVQLQAPRRSRRLASWS